MSEIILPRRSFLLGSLATLFVAPAIIRSGVLMPVKGFAESVDPLMDLDDYQAQFRDFKAKFLVDYRKSPDARAAKEFDVGRFASKWAGRTTYQNDAYRRQTKEWLAGDLIKASVA